MLFGVLVISPLLMFVNKGINESLYCVDNTNFVLIILVSVSFSDSGAFYT